MFAVSSSGWFALTNHKIIKVGVVYPMTGNASPYGEYAIKAFRLAVDELKESGVKIDVVYEDGKCNPKDAVIATNKLINVDNVDFLVGFCTGEVLAMAPIAEANKKILFAPGSTGARIGESSRYVFRTIGSEETGVKKLAPYLVSKGIKKIATISENTDFAQSINNSFKENFIKAGGNIVFAENFNADNVDFKTTVMKLKYENVDNIFIVVQSYKNSLTLLKEMKEQGYAPNIYTSDSVISLEALNFYKENELGNIIEGSVFITVVFDENNLSAQNLFKKYKEKYGSTEGPIPTTYLATYYDVIYMIKDGVDTVGFDSEELIPYFSKLTWKGASGEWKFDESGNAITDTVIKTIKNGEIVNN